MLRQQRERGCRILSFRRIGAVACQRDARSRHQSPGIGIETGMGFRVIIRRLTAGAREHRFVTLADEPLGQIPVQEVRRRAILVPCRTDRQRLVGAGHRHEQVLLLAGQHCSQTWVASGRVGAPDSPMQHEIGQILAAEQRGAFRKVRPYILLDRGQPYMPPMVPGGAGGGGQCHGLFDRPDMRQRIRFDLHRPDLVHEGDDILPGGAVGGELEQPHRHVKPVVGGTASHVVAQGGALPDAGHAGRIPGQRQRVLCLPVGQPVHAIRNAADHIPHPAERDGLGVPAQDRAERIQYGRGGRLGIVERQHQVHRPLAERQFVVGGFARQHAVVHVDRRRTPRRLPMFVHGIAISFP